MPYRQQRFIARWFQRGMDALSFNQEIRAIAEGLSRRVEEAEDITPDLISHPGGVTRAFYKRRMGMADAYIRIARDLGHDDYHARLHALKTLISLSFHAKTVTMPLNTARVQIGIMKEAVKNIHNRRRQMEMIADFSAASFGQPQTIRRFLRELRRIETPESGQPTRDMDLGWDDHVHDNLSEGRKTPSQLILDAFIKGISTLTLVYYDIPRRDIVQEALEAGRILGVGVTIAVEFSVGPQRRRKHFLLTPPQDGTAHSFFDYFNLNCRYLSTFVEGLEENRRRRHRVIGEILDQFNATHRVALNQAYGDDGLFLLPPIDMKDLESYVPSGQFSRFHLSELLYDRLRSVLHRRVLYLKTQYEVGRQLRTAGRVSDWELKRIEAAYRVARGQYTNLNPGGLRESYFSSKHIVDYDSAFPFEDHILPDLHEAGGTIVFTSPLEHGLNVAVDTLIRCHATIDAVEIMNMRDNMERNPVEVTRLAEIVRALNAGSADETRRLVLDWTPLSPDPDILEKAARRYGQRPLRPLAASASTGWTPGVPGMGFIRASRIPAPSRRAFTQTHYRLPRSVSGLILGAGRVPVSGEEDEESIGDEVYSLGKIGHFKPNLVGDEERLERITPGRMWRYLNPALKNLFRVATGLVPAAWWFGMVAPVANPLNTVLFYPVLWFCITFFRNVFVDLVAWSGIRITRWSVKGIDFNNAAQSLFWTGFTVPILGSVKLAFDAAWPLEASGTLYEWSKFLVICVANGAYISLHNKLRGFDDQVIRANFFRTLLAWPFSAIFAPAGNLMGVPSIVQAKFWSDVVAAIIEGLGKFWRMVALRRRDLEEILPLLESGDRESRMTAALDVLYIWAVRQRGQTCLANILKGNDGILAALASALRLPFSRPENREAAAADRDRKRTLGFRCLGLMLRLFDPQSAQYEFGRFALEKYRSHEILVINDLINRNIVPFHRWLRRLRRRVGPGPGTREPQPPLRETSSREAEAGCPGKRE